jgi:phosphoglycerate kinase
MSYRTLDQADVAGKTVIVRADLNVPTKDGEVSETIRIERVAPTIAHLAAEGAKIVVISHFGRPKGRDATASLQCVVTHLSKAVGLPIEFAADCVGEDVTRKVKELRNGEILLLENLRFYPGEETNDPEFTKQLAALGDIYVNDAFSASHRAHASISGLPIHLPAYAGRLMETELKALERALEKPQHPVLAVVGGSKISTKLGILLNLIGKVDKLVLGGAMATTFLAAADFAVGQSMCEHDMLDTAREIRKKAESLGCAIILPVDVVVGEKLEPGAAFEIVPVTAVPPHGRIFDIGPRSIDALIHEIAACKTVLWNGPLGVFEVPPFDRGTNAVAVAVAEATLQGRLISVAGGGETAAAMAQAGTEGDFTYVSNAGGAFLEWLEGKTLPGVQALISA